jgi:hypothetical protein
LASRDDITPLPRTVGAAIGLLALTATVLLGPLGQSPADAVPGPVRFLYATGELVPIPAAIPHEEGDMVDRRIVPDLRWIAQRFPIYITDGYSGRLPSGEHVGCRGCHVKHSDHYNGLAVDISPLQWSSRCDAGWRGITRLAKWAEPLQNQPRAPFRWVGYDGDSGHGCGNHLHLSWDHAPAPQFQLAEWVAVFPVGNKPPAGQTPPPAGVQPQPLPPDLPRGGVSTVRGGGISPRGD